MKSEASAWSSLAQKCEIRADALLRCPAYDFESVHLYTCLPTYEDVSTWNEVDLPDHERGCKWRKQNSQVSYSVYCKRSSSWSYPAIGSREPDDANHSHAFHANFPRIDTDDFPERHRLKSEVDTNPNIWISDQ